jgi:multiple sugar transport system permease protein
MIMTGLKTGVQNIAYPPEFLFTPTLENFKAVFEQHNFFRYLMNSLIIATLATGLSLVLGLPAAYSIAKYRQSKIGIVILLARMTPFVSYLLPWYIIFRYLKLIDTYTALTLTHLIITLPMVAWLMVAFFESVPAELEDAAMIDGCSRLKTFLIIVLPLVRNGIATSAIMSFIFSWNQFLFSLILSGPQTKTVPVAVYNFISYGKIDWAGIGAAATLIVLPVSVFAFFVRKTIVQGLTMGALKD